MDRTAGNGSGTLSVPMLDPEIVVRIRAPHQLGWGTKRIAIEVCCARNSVRRYLREGAAAEVQMRPGAWTLDERAQALARTLLDGVAFCRAGRRCSAAHAAAFVARRQRGSRVCGPCRRNPGRASGLGRRPRGVRSGSQGRDGASIHSASVATPVECVDESYRDVASGREQVNPVEGEEENRTVRNTGRDNCTISIDRSPRCN
jgi:hypothetical protein